MYSTDILLSLCHWYTAVYAVQLTPVTNKLPYRGKLWWWKTLVNCWIKCIWWDKLANLWCPWIENINITVSIVDSVILIYQLAYELRKVGLASVLSSSFTFSIDSMIWGYHVFKDLHIYWSRLWRRTWVCEPGNLSDPYMVAVKKEISGDAVIVGCVLDQYLQYFPYL